MFGMRHRSSYRVSSVSASEDEAAAPASRTRLLGRISGLIRHSKSRGSSHEGEPTEPPIQKLLYEVAHQKSNYVAAEYDNDRIDGTAEDAFGRYKADNDSHLFLWAYFNGELKCLQACLDELKDAHGQRSFLALANSSKVTITEWLSYFNNHLAKNPGGRLAEFVTGTREQRGILGRAFFLLYSLTAMPRIRTLQVITEDTNAETIEESITFVDFNAIEPQVERAWAVSRRLVRGTAVDNHSELPTDKKVDVALDGVSPAHRLMRAASRHAKQCNFEEVREDLKHLWDLFFLEPAVTIHTFISARPPAAPSLGFVLRTTAKALIQDSSYEGAMDALVMALSLCVELMNVSAQIVQQKENIRGQKTAAGKFLTKFMVFARLSSKAKVCSEADQALAHELATRSKKDLLETDDRKVTMSLLQERSIVLTMAVLSGSSEDERIASVFGSCWKLIDALELPESKTMRPLLEVLAKLCGFSQQVENEGIKKATSDGQALKATMAKKQTIKRSGTAVGKGAKKAKRLGSSAAVQAPKTNPTALDQFLRQDRDEHDRVKNGVESSSTQRIVDWPPLEALKDLHQAMTRNAKESVLEQRQDCAILYGILTLVDKLVQDQIFWYGHTDATKDLQAVASEIADLLSKPAAKNLLMPQAAPQAREATGSRRRRCMLDPVLKAEIGEFRRSLCHESASATWYELCAAGQDYSDSDEEASDDENLVRDLDTGNTEASTASTVTDIK
eukprot:TRINITY_DN10285_c0_g1_i1.p1 TRINITY_DN10285_c0_g1~~TRINITY_DN10285_c0_g1_i1.p1  ORF type:complete len:733 (-),score=111.89 TRINITY_DN10285_c0_g1_i1:239-2437(-)